MIQRSNLFTRAMVCLVAGVCLAVTLPADAKRLGGGKAAGKQSSMTQQAPKAPNNSPTPANAAQSTAAPTAPAAAGGAAAAGKPATQAATNPGRSMLMGLAAGLGLMALASYFGFGAALAQALLIGLLALVLMVVGFWAWRRFASGPSRGSSTGSMRPGRFQPAFAAAGAAGANTAWRSPVSTTGLGSSSHSAGATTAAQTVPGLDEASFVASAKRGFVALQAAWDTADHASLRDLMTDELLANIEEQLAERGTAPNRTDVVTLEARFLGAEVVEGYELASVEFSGMIREEERGAAEPFREIWNMTRPVSGSRGWLVAGIQPLQ